MGDKKGQMKLSFGMIFSIILIIFFMAFAFFAIKKLIEFQDDVKLKKFVDDLKKDIKKIWRSSGSSSETFSYSVPKKVERICFVQPEYENDENFEIHFSDRPFPDERLIEHVNLTKREECFYPSKGRMELILKKDFGERSVTVDGAE